MDVALKVTDQPQESAFFDLVGGDSVLSIPLFQRPYRWSERHLDWLLDDIAAIKDGAAKSCFLGVIVCVSRGALPGRAIPWEIVDGQQRLTSLYLLLLAAADVAARNGSYAWAAGVIGSYLLVRPLADNRTNTKLVPSFADRAQFKKIWDNLMSIAPLATHPTILANPPRPPAPSGGEDGALLKQFVRMKRKIGKIYDEQGQEAVERLVQIATGSLSVVSISLRDPLVAPKIFERLNNRAELVTVADLVRNEVFASASDDPTRAEQVFSNQWEPFSGIFSQIEKGLEKFLFPYGLIINRGVTKADLFATIRSHWKSLPSPEAVINDMRRYTGCFLALELDKRDLTLPDELCVRLTRLHKMGHPSSIYAFVMRLASAVSDSALDSATAAEVLDVIECFLFRRAICGIEPTGLHAVFKGLWPELDEGEGAPGVSAQTVREAISSKPTVAWPSNEEFAKAIQTGDLYHRKIVKYALREYEVSAEGESPLDDFQVEHICPQELTPSWDSLFGERHKELLHTWANMIPLTGRMNINSGQDDFEIKQREYENSIFATARGIASEYVSWTPVEVEARAAKIAAWAMNRWPFDRA